MPLDSSALAKSRAIFLYKNYLLVGHSTYKQGAEIRGAIYIYKKGAITYKLHQTIIGTESNLYFGADVVMNDKYIVVGSSGSTTYGSAGTKKRRNSHFNRGFHY